MPDHTWRSPGEVAATMGVSLSTVYRRLAERPRPWRARRSGRGGVWRILVDRWGWPVERAEQPIRGAA